MSEKRVAGIPYIANPCFLIGRQRSGIYAPVGTHQT